MTTVRTFYWDAKATQPRNLMQPRKWRVGNAGDLLNGLIVNGAYGVGVENVDDGTGRRLILVGSVAHRIEAGDLVYGIGTKGAPIPPPDESPCTIRATRGPITTEAFRQAGHDLGDLRFEFDPGLLITRYMPHIPDAVPNEVIYIPHYRDKMSLRRFDRGLDLINIDMSPLDLAMRVARAEMVYTSSLHGLIFAHAIGRPARLVAPRSAEPMIKYQDYYSSVNLPWQQPVSIAEALREPKPTSPVDLPASLSAVELPTLDELVERQIARRV